MTSINIKKTERGVKSAAKNQRDNLNARYRSAWLKTTKAAMMKREKKLALRSATVLHVTNRAQRSELGRLNPHKK